MDRIDAGQLPLAGVLRATQAAFEKTLAVLHVSADQYNAMVYAGMVEQKTGGPMQCVTRSTRAEQAAASRRMRSLEERGLIVRLSNTPTETRTTHYRLTEAGWELLATVRAALDHKDGGETESNRG